MFLSKVLSVVIPIFPFVPSIPDEGYIDTEGPALPGNTWGDLFDGFGDFFAGIGEGVVSIAEFVESAFTGAVEILGYIADLFPSLDILTDLIGGDTSRIVGVILSVMATVITFKVVGYFT